MTKELKFTKLYAELAVCLEQVGGNHKTVLRDIEKMTVHELLETLSANDIGFKVNITPKKRTKN